MMHKTTREELLQLHLDTCLQARTIMEAKNTDYSGADEDALRNFRLIEHLGIPIEIGILTRLGDKIARIANCIRKKECAVKEETVRDTILDAINYLVILQAAINEEKK